MRKIFALIFCAVLTTLLVLSGCGGSKSYDNVNAFSSRSDTKNYAKEDDVSLKFGDATLNIPSNTAKSNFTLKITEIPATVLPEEKKEELRQEYGIPPKYDIASSLYDVNITYSSASKRFSTRFSTADDITGKAELIINFIAYAGKKYVVMFVSKDRSAKLFTPLYDIGVGPVTVRLETNNLSGVYIILALPDDFDEAAITGFNIQSDKLILVAPASEPKFLSDLTITSILESSKPSDFASPILKIKSSEPFDLGAGLIGSLEDGYYKAEAHFPNEVNITAEIAARIFTIPMRDVLYNPEKHPPQLFVWAETPDADGIYRSSDILSIGFGREPRLVSFQPAEGAQDVPVNTPIKITFSESMDESCTKQIIVKDDEGEVAELARALSSDKKVLTVQPPATLWKSSTAYTVIVPDTVKTVVGAGVASETFSFTTAEKPYVVSTVPADDAIDVTVHSLLKITFSEAMDLSCAKQIIVKDGENKLVDLAGSFSSDNTVLTIQPPATLWKNDTTYTVIISEEMKNVSGASVVPATFSFTVISAFKPYVASTVPADDDKDVESNSPIKIIFSEPIDSSCSSLITVKCGNDTVESLAKSFSNDNKVLTIQPPSTFWESGATYTVTVPNEVKNLSGANIAPLTFSFTIMSDLKPCVVSTVPAEDSIDVAVNTSLKITFSEPMDPACANMIVVKCGDNTIENLEGTFSSDNTVLTIEPPATLWKNSTAYAVTVPDTVKTLSGMFVIRKNFSFVTARQPYVISHIPADDGNVGVNTSIKITFSEPMDASCANLITVKCGDDTVEPLVKSFSSDNTVLTIEPPATLWKNAASYLVSVPKKMKSLSGANVVPATFFFTVKLALDNYLDSVTPLDGASAVPINTPIKISFLEPIDPSCENLVLVKELAKEGEDEVILENLVRSFSSDNKVLTIQPPAALWKSGTPYTVTVPDTVKTISGMALVAKTFSFVTVLKPYVVSHEPADGKENVAVNAPIKITFSEAINDSSANVNLIAVKYLDANNIEHTMENLSRTFNNNKTSLTIELPVGTLWKNSTEYTVTIPDTVRTQAGMGVVEKSFSFTVTGPLTVACGNVNPANDEPFVLNFSSVPDRASLNLKNVTLKQGDDELILGDDYDFTLSDKTLSIAPLPSGSFWKCGETYSVTLGTEIKDKTGNAMAKDVTFSFVVTMFGGGSGSITDPYIVRNVYHIDNIRAGYLDKHYKQTANIDLSTHLAEYYQDDGWLPIGDDKTPFSGSYNGLNRSVTGLWIKRKSDSYVGLFGKIYEGAVENLNVVIPSGAEILGYSNVGGIAGLLVGERAKGKIANCTVSGKVSAIGTMVGGIVGELGEYNKIDLCSFSAGKIEGNASVGGIAGIIRAKANVSNCNVIQDTQVIGRGDSVGGIVGCANIMSPVDPGNPSKILGCSFNGYVINLAEVPPTGSSSAAGTGGIVGNCSTDFDIENCTVQGAIKAENVCEVGGIVGHSEAALIFNCSFNSAEPIGIVGDDMVGGIAGWSEFIAAPASQEIKDCGGTANILGKTNVNPIVGYGKPTLNNTPNSGNFKVNP
ncbi:MAG: Ig-like domain-containing protein [Candidatus Riflebacteria bacterium]|nr:Ig-like domain-containing protein [Candidatus Riflebacteria bacterium]